MANGVTIAILLEKTKAIRDRVAEIDRKTADDNIFRQLIMEYFNLEVK